MQKLSIAVALASLVATTAVAKTQQNEKPVGGTPSAPAAVDCQSPVPPPQPQQPPTRPLTGYRNRSPEFNEALNKADEPRAEAVRQARKLFDKGDLVGAETWCRRALTLTPLVSGKPWHHEEVPMLGDILMIQGRYEEALECYLSIVADQRRRGNLEPDDPDHPTPNIGAALAYCRLGDFEMAKKYFPAAVVDADTASEEMKEYPGSGDIRALEASLLFIRGSQEGSFSPQALRHFEAAEKLAPDNWMIVNRIGYVLYDLKRYEEAIAYYRREMQLGGDKTPYHHRMRVEMYDLWQKQKEEKANKPKENKPQEKDKSKEKAPQ